MEMEFEMKQQEEEQRKEKTKEPDNIHEMIYNIATGNRNTTVQLDPPGGSENFHEELVHGTLALDKINLDDTRRLAI